MLEGDKWGNFSERNIATISMFHYPLNYTILMSRTNPILS